MRVDLAPMRTFPDLALPDHGGVVRSLSELAGGDPPGGPLFPRLVLSEGARLVP